MVSAVACMVPAAVALASGTSAGVTVAPKVGTPKTEFVVTFRAPDRSGDHGGLSRDYEVSAAGGSSGCHSSGRTSLPPTRKGARVHAVVPPGAGRWCVGSYAGRVEEWLRPICGGAHPFCPQFIAIKMIGTFSFRVRGATADTTPPRFAGLKSAIQCVPGPERPHERIPVHLSWNAATDNVTPSSRIMYEIYSAARAGGENFARPEWALRGVTQFETPSVGLGEFFVVRARDQAGNADHNRVERQAVSPCV